MPGDWRIVLAPESQVPGDGELGTLPLIPSETVAKALEQVPFLRRNGLRFESPRLEPFEVSADGIRVLDLAEVGDALTIAAIAECLARGVGPVTILDDDAARAEVRAGESPDAIAAMLQGSESRRRTPSLHPPAFAPGRPGKRLLPPLKTVLLVTVVLGLLGIPAGIHRGLRGLLGCDGPAPKPEASGDPAVWNTESAMIYVKLFLSGGKGREPDAEGRIEVPGSPEMTSHLVVRAADGKLYVCDGWKHPLRVARQGSSIRLTSFGPNGIDDHGRGDDIVRTFPLR